MRRHRLLLPNGGLDWRLTPPYPTGYINALPESHGRVICTTGVLCYILLDESLTIDDEARQPLFLGHLENFITDQKHDAELVEHFLPAKVVAQRHVKPAKLTVDQLMSRYAI